MATTMNEQTGGSAYDPAVEFALVQLKAKDDPDKIRTLIKERFALKEADIAEVMQLATALYEHKEKNF